jgi:hypothetical protein
LVQKKRLRAIRSTADDVVFFLSLFFLSLNLLLSLNPRPPPQQNLLHIHTSSLRFLAAALLALAATKKVNATLSSSFAAVGGLSAAEEEAIRKNEADYSHFAELVATVMIVRGEKQ